ncbi:MAG: PEP-CTERM sorting domain-containing protein [Deltaproteobacteria bacterium]|nr:PEP-CTERM sorting domain-containing protein [Deltaproteobacteria bacterium]
MNALGTTSAGFAKVRNRTNLMAIFLFCSAFLILLSCHSANALTVFSSYPHNWDGGGWIVPGNYFAARFDVEEDYLINKITLPLHLNPDGGPLLLEVQIWDNQYADVGGETLPRPNTMLGSWLTEPVPSMDDPAPRDISAVASNPVAVLSGKTYWVKFLPTWSSVSDSRAILWFESLPYEGQNISDRMIYWSAPGTVTPGNPWDGNYMAFELQGKKIEPIPEPSTTSLIGFGLVGIAGLRRWLRR